MLVHARLAYGRGRGYLDISSGLLGGFVATGNLSAAAVLFPVLLLLYTFIGHIDKRYLRLWQEENKQSSALNPLWVEMHERLKRIEKKINLA